MLFRKDASPQGVNKIKIIAAFPLALSVQVHLPSMMNSLGPTCIVFGSSVRRQIGIGRIDERVASSYSNPPTSHPPRENLHTDLKIMSWELVLLPVRAGYPTLRKTLIAMVVGLDSQCWLGWNPCKCGGSSSPTLRVDISLSTAVHQSFIIVL